jgi:DNA polymerase-3 subunit epsilon
MNKIFCFDLETTGLGEMGEPIVPVQIAALILDGGHPDLPEIDVYHTFVKVPSYAHVEEGAMAMHAKKGRTLDWYQANGQDPAVVYPAIMDFIRRYGSYVVPAGHNAAAYDMPIFRREVKRYLGPTYKMPLDYHVMDTMSFALFDLKFANSKIQKANLQALCDHLGVPLNAAEAHDALVDIRATAECLRRLVRMARTRTA